ncbi:MAG: 2-oxoglutarate dehydrogenase complex dihydrolipoyllysine-residue succinyltransferase [Alphaproteobacteria bacterium]|nr:2-oxoglutarate dehydrogenase complex dihydrolipoyllysine-residue succinyltransferase [Alphaproteobacteria bacterium]
MPVDITVPQLGESVTEATVATWLRQKGETVNKDEPLLELETDKATMEVYAPVTGVITDVLHAEGADVAVGAVVGRITEGADEVHKTAEAILSPAVRRALAEHGLDAVDITGTGKDGRLTKADVLEHARRAVESPPTADAAQPSQSMPDPPAAPLQVASVPPSPPDPEGREERVRMNRVRKRIAERLKAAQNTAAMLTTFNEADMTAVMEARRTYRDLFERKHGVRLGFMSFFVHAAVQALMDVPAVNGEIAGDEIVYKHYYHVGVAVSAPQGLVVPVLRDADSMSLADVEKAIAAFAAKARDGSLVPDDLTGGTFTISNGGIFGSLLSTPILNPPQSAILGMHKIQERPVVVAGDVVVRPMMYLALSYDHRIVDGREAVTFLVRIKEAIEDPQRLLLKI